MISMPLLILASAGFLGLAATGVTFVGLSLLVDVARGLPGRRRLTRPEFWHEPVPAEEEEALIYPPATSKRQAGNGL